MADSAAAIPEKWTLDWVMSNGHPQMLNKDFFLMNPIHMLVTVVGYFIALALLRVAVSVRGKPFVLRVPMLLHNFGLFSLSLYMMVEILRQAFVVNSYVLWGNGVDESPKGAGMARIIHIYYLSKIWEFMDTFFMALRGKTRQISFLHLYHHASIFIIWWIITYYAPGGDSYFSAALNSFIHVIMYGYYFWAAVAPKLPEGAKPTMGHPSFYRRYITTCQLTQFMLMLAQAIYVSLFPGDYPVFCANILFYYMFTMLGLFGNFFISNYGGSKKKKQK